MLVPGTPAHTAVVGGDDVNRQFEFRQTINGEGATLKGVELALNLPFSAFSDSLKNFGVLGNITFVDSEADYTLVGASVYNPVTNRLEAPAAQVYTRTLFPTAKRSWNATAYYDDGKFSVRSSVAYRSSYLDGSSATGNLFEGYGESLNVDASIRYQVTEQLEVLVEGTNLLDDYRYRFTDDATERNYENNHYGRTFIFGVRYKM